MNIETLLLKSINKFKQTIRVIAPLIIIYNILSYLFTPPILRTYQLDQNIETMLLGINSQDIIFSFILIMLFSLYTITKLLRFYFWSFSCFGSESLVSVFVFISTRT